MHSPIISEIQRRVRHTREENKKDHQLEMEYPTFADDVTSEDFLQPGDISGSELWFLPPSAPLALPPVPDDMGDNGGRSPPELACWHSHFEVLRKIADGDDDVALIFEDDIDMEWDLERRLRYLWRFLPNKWDLVFIGMLHLFVPATSVHTVMIIQAIVWAANPKGSPSRVLRTYIHPLTPGAHMHTPCRRRVPHVSFGSCDHPSSRIPCPSVGLTSTDIQIIASYNQHQQMKCMPY